MNYRFAVVTTVVTTNPDTINTAALSIGLLALLEKIPDDTRKENVHRLRTTVRRLEVHLPDCPAKIAKSLKRLRKKAGKMRDIDVHLGLLKPPLIPRKSPQHDSASEVQSKLRELLKDERERQVGTLRKLVIEAAPRMRLKLPLLVEHADHQRTVTAAQAHHTAHRVRQRFMQMTRRIPQDPERLHRLRINTKNLRYSLEPLSQFSDCAELAAHLKQVQDAIGAWHDWATLSEIAAHELKSPEARPVCEALKLRTAREYRKALRTCASVRTWISSPTPASTGDQRHNYRHHNRSLHLIRKAG